MECSLISVVNSSPEGPVVTTVGGSAHFWCSSAIYWLENIIWRANGSNITENVNVIIKMSFGRGRLELNNVSLEYNSTWISCHSVVRGNEITISRRQLLLQGKELPSPV